MADSIETQNSSSKEGEIKQVIESSQTETRTLRQKIKDARWNLADWNIWWAIAAFFKDEISIQQNNKENSNKTNESTAQQSNNENSNKANESTPNQQNNEENSNKTNESTTQQSNESKEKEPNDSEIVSIKKHLPEIKYDLKYATTDNSFWWKIIYPDKESNLKLRFDTIKKLIKAQEILKKQWYELKIWDAYRPKEAQQILYDNYKWPAATKSSNVAKPWTSHHWTWKAVDLTLIDSNWNEIEMPTKFDDFSGNAKRDKMSTSNSKRKNAMILRKAMEQAWFYTIASEWWHYQTDQWKSTLPHSNN